MRATAMAAMLMAAALPCTARADADAAAAAPAAAGDVVPEIIVTATRQATALRKVPISVAVVTQEKLDEAGAKNIDDIARLAPGLSVSTSSAGAGTKQNISIRGISSQVGAATTGIYIDDTPVQTRALGNATSNAYPLLYDLDRVEVLRGPQGTLFGAGAEGGVVRFITPQPSLKTYSGSVRADLAATEGGAPSREVAGAVGGPIIKDMLGFRISGIYRHDGGYIDRVDRFTGAVSENDNKNDSYSVRGAMTFKPTRSLTITGSILDQHTHAPGSPVFFLGSSDVDGGNFANQFATRQLRDDKMTLPTLTISADLGAAEFISTTSYLDRKASVQTDYSNFIPAVLFGNPLAYNQGEYSLATITDAQQNWTQEFRLQSKPGNKLSWTVGAYFQDARQSGNQVNYDPFADAMSLRVTGKTIAQLTGVALVNGTDLFHTSVHSTDRQVAGFGEATYEVVDGVKLIAGARVARSTVDLQRASSGPVAGASTDYTGSQKETPITPRFGASWQVNADTMVYASVSKGFRVGGVNSPVLSLCQASIAASGLTVGETYKSDSVWSSEVGAKFRSNDGKFSIAASAFNIDWSNIQKAVSLSACGSGFTANLGKANSRGTDVSIDLRPMPGLLLNVAVAYVDARLSETIYNGSALLGSDGDNIGVAPWGVSAAARYEFPISDTKTAYVRADYQYNDRTPKPNIAVTGTDPLAVGSEAFNNVSLRGGVMVGDYNVSLYVNNLLNEHPVFGQGRDSTRSPLFFATTARPRTIGLTASMNF